MQQLRPDLTRFFNPKSIAIVGVSKRASSLGGMSYLNYLLDSGFPGRLYPINPQAKKILFLQSYPNLTSLPEMPELAIVCVPAAHVPSVLEECAQNGLKHIHILSAGFRETGTEEQKEMEEQYSLTLQELTPLLAQCFSFGSTREPL